jgi:hypothetical protein
VSRVFNQCVAAEVYRPRCGIGLDSQQSKRPRVSEGRLLDDDRAWIDWGTPRQRREAANQSNPVSSTGLRWTPLNPSAFVVNATGTVTGAADFLTRTLTGLFVAVMPTMPAAVNTCRSIATMCWVSGAKPVKKRNRCRGSDGTLGSSQTVCRAARAPTKRCFTLACSV